MLLHGAEPTALLWTWEPSVLLGLAAWTVLYLLAAGPLRRRFGPEKEVSPIRQAAFHTGTLLVFLALSSPLDAVADHDLFSAHMVQHLLLTYAAPPLWLAGMPAWPFKWAARRWRLPFQENGLFLLAAAYLTMNGVMWAWHLPAAYDAALENEGLHIFEHLTMIGSALIGWWPVLGPGSQALGDLGRSLYLFLSTLPCTALAALITLSDRALYPFYSSHPQLWGLAPLADQQLGGLLMWLPVDMLLMAVTLASLYRWLRPVALAQSLEKT